MSETYEYQSLELDTIDTKLSCGVDCWEYDYDAKYHIGAKFYSLFQDVQYLTKKLERGELTRQEVQQALGERMDNLANIIKYDGGSLSRLQQKGKVLLNLVKKFNENDWNPVDENDWFEVGQTFFELLDMFDLPMDDTVSELGKFIGFHLEDIIQLSSHFDDLPSYVRAELGARILKAYFHVKKWAEQQ